MSRIDPQTLLGLAELHASPTMMRCAWSLALSIWSERLAAVYFHSGDVRIYGVEAVGIRTGIPSVQLRRLRRRPVEFEDLASIEQVKVLNVPDSTRIAATALSRFDLVFAHRPVWVH